MEKEKVLPSKREEEEDEVLMGILAFLGREGIIIGLIFIYAFDGFP
jgi:hypothetical protein